MSVELPRFPWPYQRVGSSFHRCTGSLEEDLFSEWIACVDEPGWLQSRRGRFVCRALDSLQGRA